ncbi:MAG: amidase [Candidatus Dormibacteraeota bacterium]|nr:amidase [Candidatus Dormibacteraeota bacterium]
MTDDLVELTIREAADLLAARKVSASELTRATLARIERTEPVLHAYVSVMRESAFEAASRADLELNRRGWRGPLHGIPVGVKDICYTTDAPTEGGSATMRGFRPGYDATVVSRLREAGAVIVGKTHTHEFAYGQNIPPTRNAWNPEYSPGGSSAGSGVAVAARSAFGAIGTDGGGSIRMPAALNGIVGLKPTCGRVSRHGVIPMSATLDHVGPLTRTVEDCALMMNAVAGYDPLDAQSIDVPVPDYASALGDGVRGLRLGVERDYFFYPAVTAEYRAAVESAMRQLEDLGARLVEVSIPELELVAGIFLNIIATDTSAYHRKLLREKPADYVSGTRVMLEFGELIFGTDYLIAQRGRRVLREAVRDAFSRHRLDALVAPSNIVTAVPMSRYSTSLFGGAPEDSTGALHQLSPANVLGLPSLAVPCGFSEAGLPVSFTLYGRPFEDGTLLRMGSAYQEATNWHQRTPPLAAAVSP